MSTDYPSSPSNPANSAGHAIGLLDDTSTTGGLVLVKVWPNPFYLQTSIRFDIEWDQSVKVKIVTASGRRVRTLTAGFRLAGQHHVTWDGLDDAGLHVRAGVYYAVVRGAEETRTVKVTLRP